MSENTRGFSTEPVATFTPKKSTRGRKSIFSECELDKFYWLKEGEHFRKNTDTAEEGPPKLNSVRSSLNNEAKRRSEKVGRTVIVNIETGTDTNTKKDVLRVQFALENKETDLAD